MDHQKPKYYFISANLKVSHILVQQYETKHAHMLRVYAFHAEKQWEKTL